MKHDINKFELQEMYIIVLLLLNVINIDICIN